MKTVNVILLTTTLAVQASYGTDETNPLAETKASTSNAEQMKALRTEAGNAEAAYLKAIGSRQADSKIEELWKAYTDVDRTNLAQIFQLAKQEPASEPAFETFAWIMTNRLTQGWVPNSNVTQTLAFLRDYHATNPDLARICWKLGRNWDPTCEPAMDLLHVVIDKNPSREVRGQATLALARLKKTYAEDLVSWRNESPGDARQKEFLTAYLQKAKGENSEALSREAERLFKVVLDQYADCPTLLPTNQPQVRVTLGEVASAELYELNHLTVGKVVPEIVGEDIDSKEFKLSDYRGKVVVLNFWAAWCGPCMQMVPSEVRLAERMKGKPFAMVGVNGDAIRDDAKHAVANDKMTWRSFWSDKGPHGPIPTAWNISGWPTVFVLDPDGVIRFRFTGYGTMTESMLNQEVDQVLKQFGTKGGS